MGDNVFKAQYGGSKTDVGAADDAKVNSWTVGYDRMLGKDAKVYAYYTDWSRDNNNNTPANPVPATAQADKNTLGVGFELKF